MIRKAIFLVIAFTLVLIPPLSALDDIEYKDRLRYATAIPPFEFKSLEGTEIASDGLIKQKVILLAFWSMYCKACIDKFGALIKIRQKYSPECLEIISINTDGEYRLPDDTIRDFINGLETRERFKVNFPVVYDRENHLAQKLGIIFLPAIVTVDLNGKIAGTYRRFSEDSVDEIVSGIVGIIPTEGLRPHP